MWGPGLPTWAVGPRHGPAHHVVVLMGKLSPLESLEHQLNTIRVHDVRGGTLELVAKWRFSSGSPGSPICCGVSILKILKNDWRLVNLLDDLFKRCVSKYINI